MNGRRPAAAITRTNTDRGLGLALRFLQTWRTGGMPIAGAGEYRELEVAIAAVERIREYGRSSGSREQTLRVEHRDVEGEERAERRS